MLARLVRALPEGAPWQYEIKWDGYRMEAIKDAGAVKLLSRNAGNYTERFPAAAAAVARLKAASFVLDGEVVAVDLQGRPSFQVLQARNALPEGWRILYCAFDLLHLNGADLLRVPLLKRRRQLQVLLRGSDVLLSPVLNAAVPDIVRAISQEGLEGIVAKRTDSFYEPGQRSGVWVKLPLKRRQEFVVGGYRPGGANFELLLVGYYEAGEFRFAGKVRQGFTPQIRAAVFPVLRPLRTPRCQFADLPNSRTDHFGETVTAEEMDSYVWLRPAAVAEVKFTEWTRANVLRHAEFVALRDDKAPRQVVRES